MASEEWVEDVEVKREFLLLSQEFLDDLVVRKGGSKAWRMEGRWMVEYLIGQWGWMSLLICRAGICGGWQRR